MGAMPEEIASIVPRLKHLSERSLGGRTYYSGELHGKKVVLTFSRWGKVAAASTATILLHEFHVTDLLFTGVAGAIEERLRPGDIVIAEKLIQHDLDARPLMSRHEIPLLGETWIETDPVWRKRLCNSVQEIFSDNILHSLISEEDLRKFGIKTPSFYQGEIASGDQFFSSSRQKKELQAILPDVLCIEMEGAAVAQVCFENNLPFAVLRTISDGADEHSPVDFPLFINQIASHYSLAVLDHLFRQF